MLALDTETTGLYHHHGCRPFFVSGCDDQGNLYKWQWSVDPHTRHPRIPDQDLKQLQQVINAHTDVTKPDPGIVFHNAKFDLHALTYIGIKIPPWSMIHDTVAMSHCLDSAEPHGLKDLSAKYLGIEDEDQTDLMKAVNRARNIGKKLGWAVASETHPTLLACNGKAPKSGWGVCDYWLPRAVALHDLAEEQYFLSQKGTMAKAYKPLLTPGERTHWLTVCETYAMTDAERTILLYALFKKQLLKEALWKQYLFQRATLGVAFALERNGVTLRDNTDSVIESLNEKAEGHYKIALRIGQKASDNKDFNPNSALQLQKLLYETWKLPVIKQTEKGNPSTDFDTVVRLAFLHTDTPRQTTFLKELVHSKKLFKTADSGKLFGVFRVGHKLHPDNHMTGTATTRQSVSNPPTQIVGKGGATSNIDDPDVKDFIDELGDDNISLRSIFGPRPGRVWYSIDYQQLQLRLFAHISGETTMIKAFDDGWDAHEFIAHKVFTMLKQLKEGETVTKGQRRVGKAINFGYIFGSSAEKIELVSGIPGLIDDVNAMFPNAHDFMKITKSEVRKTRMIYTIGGFKLMCDMTHKGVNYKVQGAEGIIVKRAMIDCHRYLRSECPEGFLTLQVHDELVDDMPAPSKMPTCYERMDNKTGKYRPYYKMQECPHLQELCNIMVAAGKFYGMTTPVSPELIVDSWAKGVEVE